MESDWSDIDLDMVINYYDVKNSNMDDNKDSDIQNENSMENSDIQNENSAKNSDNQNENSVENIQSEKKDKRPLTAKSTGEMMGDRNDIENTSDSKNNQHCSKVMDEETNSTYRENTVPEYDEASGNNRYNINTNSADISDNKHDRNKNQGASKKDDGNNGHTSNVDDDNGNVNARNEIATKEDDQNSRNPNSVNNSENSIYAKKTKNTLEEDDGNRDVNNDGHNEKVIAENENNQSAINENIARRKEPACYLEKNDEDIHSLNCKPTRRQSIRMKKMQPSSSEYSSSDEIPLNRLRQKNSFVENSDPEDCLESEDSYKPNKMDANSSDSNLSSMSSSSNEQMLPSKKRKLSRKGRKRSKIIKKFQAATIGEIKQKSRVEFMRRRLNQKAHLKRLDNLLFSNGLERVKVQAHGNCFFESAALFIGGKNPSELRQELCDHLDDKVDAYIEFLKSSDKPDQSATMIDYFLEVEKLRQDGFWSNRVADFLPLSLANWSNRPVRIYSSDQEKPILDIHPNHNESEISGPILLAYTAGYCSHYDGCKANVTHRVDDNYQSIDDENTMQDHSAEEPECQGHETKSGPSPRKAAAFITPPKKRTSRKRKLTPESWKKNIRKKLRLSGKGYMNQKGKTMQERKIQEVNCDKCRYHCTSKVTQEQREGLFKSYWDLGSYERQKDFVCTNIEEKKTRTYLDENEEKIGKKRQVFRVYSFFVNGQRVKVCKKFFLGTLSIGEAYTNHALLHKEGGVFASTEMRGKHKPHNKSKEECLKVVRGHIESFPRVEGHYTRQDSSRQYLGADLNVRRMYELYKEKYSNQEIVSLKIYRKVFNDEYNLAFHTPKKDQCSLCSRFIRVKDEGLVDENLRNEYEQHQKRKIRSREEKEKDKSLAKSTENMYVATFDLQAILSTPCSLISQIYYMRKLNSYNLTFYNLGNKSGTCYLWTEVDANRGSCEVATCIQLQLLSLPKNVNHAIFYSDACTGQNRNQYIACCLQYAVTSIDHIKTIDHKFLESGHTQMECDSMHSAIEFAKKKTEIFVPSQWDTVIRMARRQNPFIVVPLKHTDIWDFKDYQKKTVKNSKIDTNGNRVNWLLMKWIRFSKDEPDVMQFKCDFDEDFKRIKLSGSGGKRGRPITKEGEELKRKYNAKLPVSSQKKKDLLTLCKTGIIPEVHHPYYQALPSASKVMDRLAEPDAEEVGCDTDVD